MAFVARYLRGAWQGVFGAAQQAPNFVTKLRPRTGLKRPSRLPTTPTKSHQPPAARARIETGISSRKCPHCKGNIYIDFKSGKVTKPNSRKKNGAKIRYVTVRSGGKTGEDYLVEDLSPTTKLRPSSKRRVKYY